LAFPPGAVPQAGTGNRHCHKAVVFRSIYGFNPDYEMESSDPGCPGVVPLFALGRARSVELTNTGDELLLFDHSNKVVDALSWGSSTFAFDPSISIVAEGYSLERYPAYQDTDRALDWRKQSFPQPGIVDLTAPTPLHLHRQRPLSITSDADADAHTFGWQVAIERISGQS
jgi:hypothetical protein